MLPFIKTQMRRTRASSTKEVAFVSLVFQEAPRRAGIYKLLRRQSPGEPFRGLVVGERDESTATPTQLPRSSALCNLYPKLEALLPAFAPYVVFDETQDLVKVQVRSTPSTQAHLEDSSAATDGAIIDLLTEYAPFAVVHSSPWGARLDRPPHEWLRSLETDPVKLQVPGEVPLGDTFALNLAHSCLTLRAHGCTTSATPSGFVLSGPSSITRMAVLPWLLRPPDAHTRAAPCGEPLLFPSDASLVVVPHSRLHLWEQLLPDALVVADFTTLSDFYLNELLAHSHIVLSKEAISQQQRAYAHHTNVPAFLRASAMALVRRARCSGAQPSSTKACFHAVHFRRLVVEDVSYDLNAVTNTISAQTRIGLCENGAFFADRSYTPFTGSHPDLARLECTGCVHRLLETRTQSRAVLRTFRAESVTVGSMSALQLMSVTMSTSRFVSRLTADALSEFTEYGRRQIACRVPSECPICLTRGGKAFMPCGHAVCLDCAERLPVEATTMTIHRTPLVVRHCLTRRCPVCRSPSQAIYTRKVRASHRQRLVGKLARAASTREVWICSHWKKVLDEVLPFIRTTTFEKKVVLRLIDQSAVFPASGDAVTVIWVHPPCFFSPNLDRLNMHRAWNAVGGQHSNLHIVCADAAPESIVLHDRFHRITKRLVVPVS